MTRVLLVVDSSLAYRNPLTMLLAGLHELGRTYVHTYAEVRHDVPMSVNVAVVDRSWWLSAFFIVSVPILHSKTVAKHHFKSLAVSSNLPFKSLMCLGATPTLTKNH